MTIDLDLITYIAQGVPVTLQYTLISFVIGFVLGVALCLFRISDNIILKFFAIVYVSIFRGTPLLVQLTIVYFLVPVAFNYKITVFEAGIISFSLNSAAYISEIIRGGIASIDAGQFEAADALAIPYKSRMMDIILPQVFRNTLPSLVNEIVNLLKETAIISIIGEYDIMRRAQVVAAEQFDYFVPLFSAALFYYILVMIFSCCASFLENRLKVKHDRG